MNRDSGNFNFLNEIKSKIISSLSKTNSDCFENRNKNVNLLTTEYRIYISLSEILYGCKREITIQRKRFHKKVEIFESKTFSIKVKPGTPDGTELTFKQEGDQSEDGTLQDVIFTVNDQPHPNFTRKLSDIKYVCKVSKKQLSNSSQVAIPTLENTFIKVTLNKEIETKMKKRFYGLGLPYPNDTRKRGSLLVEFQIASEDVASDFQLQIQNELEKSKKVAIENLNISKDETIAEQEIQKANKHDPLSCTAPDSTEIAKIPNISNILLENNTTLGEFETIISKLIENNELLVEIKSSSTQLSPNYDFTNAKLENVVFTCNSTSKTGDININGKIVDMKFIMDNIDQLIKDNFDKAVPLMKDSVELQLPIESIVQNEKTNVSSSSKQNAIENIHSSSSTSENKISHYIENAMDAMNETIQKLSIDSETRQHTPKTILLTMTLDLLLQAVLSEI